MYRRGSNISISSKSISVFFFFENLLCVVWWFWWILKWFKRSPEIVYMKIISQRRKSEMPCFRKLKNWVLCDERKLCSCWWVKPQNALAAANSSKWNSRNLSKVEHQIIIIIKIEYASAHTNDNQTNESQSMYWEIPRKSLCADKTLNINANKIWLE